MKDEPSAPGPGLTEAAAHRIALRLTASYGEQMFRVGFRAGVVDIVPRRTLDDAEFDGLLSFLRHSGFQAYHVEGPEQRIVLTSENGRGRGG